MEWKWRSYNFLMVLSSHFFFLKTDWVYKDDYIYREIKRVQIIKVIPQGRYQGQPMAYFWVQVRAVDSYLVLSVLYMWAISGTKGSSGFGSVNKEQIESSTCCIITHIPYDIYKLTTGFSTWEQNDKRARTKSKTLEIVSAGLHCSFKMSRQMLPLLLMFGWNTFVLNAT